MFISGPAKSRFRGKEHPAEVRRVTGLGGRSGPSEHVAILLRRTDDGKQIEVHIDAKEWATLRDRVEKAFVFPEDR